MNRRTRRFAAELLGTFLLIALGTGSVVTNSLVPGALGLTGIAIAWGLTVTGIAVAIGHLSGAHLNPAVTIAFAATGHFPKRDVAPYVIAQVIGAILGSVFVNAVIGFHVNLGATTTILPPMKAAVMEIVLSFLLMFVVMAVATDKRANGVIGAIAVGGAVAVDVLAGGPLTGASMNPARSLAPAVVANFWTNQWLYWVGPIVGMLLAAVAYESLRPADMSADANEALGVQGPIDA